MDEKASARAAVLAIDRLVPNVYSKYNRVKARQAAHYGLTPPQTAILLLLGKSGTMRVSDIAGAMEMVDSNVSNICSRLERMDLVRRNRLADNRRVVEVALTEAAREKLALIKSDQRQFSRSIGKHICAEDMAQIERGLRLMNDLLDMALEEEP